MNTFSKRVSKLIILCCATLLPATASADRKNYTGAQCQPLTNGAQFSRHLGQFHHAGTGTLGLVCSGVKDMMSSGQCAEEIEVNVIDYRSTDKVSCTPTSINSLTGSYVVAATRSSGNSFSSGLKNLWWNTAFNNTCFSGDSATFYIYCTVPQGASAGDNGVSGYTIDER